MEKRFDRYGLVFMENTGEAKDLKDILSELHERIKALEAIIEAPPRSQNLPTAADVCGILSVGETVEKPHENDKRE